MFTLFKASPKFPKVKTVDLKAVRLYVSKFEESLKNFEELQKEGVRS
ncbi:hypothetical protein B879_00741 [Cecembia lonarensis LW9]|uniref:Uncharacterized protein n=1 Tax=Cecembia lonarensis (strain CCUG 58316 / KCTC 22772 / LW9) TaxID=1225176 RepID=K1M2L3_CECL9|nr:hypothetical protein B879_00741 [Cecembia lonarensis LW9]